jgi:ketosteroid isomerase-like protein
MPEEPKTGDLTERTRLNLRGAASGDLGSILSDLAPDAVWEVAEHSLRVAGATAIRELLEKWRSQFEDWSFKVEDVTDLGNEMILVVYSQSGRAPGSAFAVEDRGVQVCEWRDGLIVGLRLYSDITEAQAASERLAESRG